MRILRDTDVLLRAMMDHRSLTTPMRRELSVTARHAARVARLPLHHCDPFDRILVAQAMTEPLILLSADRALAPYGDFVRVF